MTLRRPASFARAGQRSSWRRCRRRSRRRRADAVGVSVRKWRAVLVVGLGVGPPPPAEAGGDGEGAVVIKVAVPAAGVDRGLLDEAPGVRPAAARAAVVDGDVVCAAAAGD